MLRINYRLPSVATIHREVRAAVDRALLDAAVFAPQLQERRIHAKLTPDGRPQRPNSPATVKRKGHATPLLDKGVLATPARYIRRKTPTGYVVDLPPNRRDVARHLRRMGYRLWEMSDELRIHFATRLQRHLSTAQARIRAAADEGTK